MFCASGYRCGVVGIESVLKARIGGQLGTPDRRLWTADARSPSWGVDDQFNLIPADLITLSHFTSSCPMNCRNSFVLKGEGTSC